jgi:hypothetical protein
MTPAPPLQLLDQQSRLAKKPRSIIQRWCYDRNEERCAVIDVDGVGLVPGSLRSGLIGLGGVDLAAEDAGCTRVFLW